MKNKQEKIPISLGLVLLCLFPALYAGNQFILTLGQAVIAE